LPLFSPSDSLGNTALKSTPPKSPSKSLSDPASQAPGMQREPKIGKDPRRKSGRRVGRPTEKPTETMKKKVEEMDKYWLRCFRAYMKVSYGLRAKLASSQLTFWDHYMSKEGEPGKKTPFRSYSRKYKESLFTNDSFRRQFALWFSQFGQENLSKKYPYASPMWELFYRHAVEQYNPIVPYLSEKNNGSKGTEEERDFVREFDEGFFIASP